jgi:hypothetical protein
VKICLSDTPLVGGWFGGFGVNGRSVVKPTT